MTSAFQLSLEGELAIFAGGGLGDLVLLAPAVACLKWARPNGRLILFCREASAIVVRFWPVPPDEVVTIDFDPEAWVAPDAALEDAVARLQGTLDGRHVPLLIDVTLRSGWFAPVLASLLGASQLLLTSPVQVGQGQALASAVLETLGLGLPPSLSVPIAPRIHERVRHQAWLAACGLAAGVDVPWQVPPADDHEARQFLAAKGLESGGYLVCCPGGAGSTPIKRWPAAQFAKVLSLWGRPAVLMGAAAEGPLLAQIASGLAGGAVILAASPHEIGLSAGILALAKCWLSNDSGLMHLAQAFGRPGVGLFGGGGRWPSYAPWAPGSIGLVRPLPCFGCDWDCLFGHAECLDSITPEEVFSALSHCISAPVGGPRIVELSSPSGHQWSLIAAASDSYQALRRETQAQQDALIALRREAGVQAKAAAERLTLVHHLHDEAARRLAIIESLQAAPPQACSAIQISTGLGAGNIGDELMAEAFWQQAAPPLRLDVALFPAAAERRSPYPPLHRYRQVDWHGNEHAGPTVPGLLVGGTPVADAEGVHFPIGFIARRLELFHAAGLPVDALGVGVEELVTPEGRAIFERAFRPIRSWSVRSEACRRRLLELGCAADSVHVGADWAWLFRPGRDLRGWAEQQWQCFGLEPGERLVLVNLVHMKWQHCDDTRRAIAGALDRLARQGDFRIGLFCNETREGEFFDASAARALSANLASEPICVPNLYWAPDEAVALIARADLTLGQRYHFALQSILAGTLPVTIPRGDKQKDLAVDTGIRQVGSMTKVDAGALFEALEQEFDARPSRLAALAEVRRKMEWRAAGNLTLLRKLEPYSGLFTGPVEPHSI